MKQVIHTCTLVIRNTVKWSEKNIYTGIINLKYNQNKFL